MSLALAERREYLKQALKFVEGSSRLIRKKMSSGFRVKLKEDKSFVTDADLAVERFLRATITKRFPDHGIIGEEFPPTKPRAEFQWILDPIDGTLSFSRSIPLFGTIIGLHHKGKPVVGVIDHPALGQCYSAAAGLGSFCNGRRLRIKDLAQGAAVEDEVVATGDRMHFIKCGMEARFDELMRRHPIARSYADCFGHTLAARGSIGGMADFGLRLWDIAATQVLIEEAGGKYVCAQTLEKPGVGTLYGIIFGKPRVVDWLIDLFTAPS